MRKDEFDYPNLEEYLIEGGHLDILEAAKNMMKADPTWDLMDCVDELDSDLYGLFCEL